jgi:FkbM family methyltransferase
MKAAGGVGVETVHRFFQRLIALGRPVGGVVQVGANIGQEIPAFERYGVGWAIMIEPLDEPFRKLAKFCRGRDRFIPVQALCSSLEGVEYEFFVASNRGESSSLLPPARHRTAYPKVEFPTSVRLVSTTVDAVVARAVAQHPELPVGQLDTLMIDVQGAELKVLMGAALLLQQVRQIYTEVSYDLYEGGATLEELQAFLGSFGFSLNTVELNHHGWGDALFLKRGA